MTNQKTYQTNLQQEAEEEEDLRFFVNRRTQNQNSTNLLHQTVAAEVEGDLLHHQEGEEEEADLQTNE